MSATIPFGAIILLVALFPALPTRGDTAEVTVVGITGKWCQVSCEAGRALRFGDPFHEGTGGVTPMECDGGTLVLLKNSRAIPFQCVGEKAADNRCSPTQRPSASAGVKCFPRLTLQEESQGLIARLLTAIPRPFIQYVTPVSRGLDPALNEAVIPLNADRIDLSDAFRDVQPGTYGVTLAPLAEGHGTASLAQVNWTGAGTASASIPGLQAGLYKLELSAPNGQAAGPDAWVLVSGPQDFSKAHAAFAEAVAATQKWPDEVDARAPRAFLRAVLDGLSRQAATQR